MFRRFPALRALLYFLRANICRVKTYVYTNRFRLWHVRRIYTILSLHHKTLGADSGRPCPPRRYSTTVWYLVCEIRINGFFAVSNNTIIRNSMSRFTFLFASKTPPQRLRISENVVFFFNIIRQIYSIETYRAAFPNLFTTTDRFDNNL